MKLKKKVTRFLKDGNALEVFLCILLACVALLAFYILINYLFPNGENYLKLTVSGMFSLGGLCISTIFANKEKNREAVLKYVTEKRLSWIEDTRRDTADLCAEVYRYVDILPNIKRYRNDIRNIDIKTTNLLIDFIDIPDDDINDIITNIIEKLKIKPYRCSRESSVTEEISKRLAECKSQDFYHGFIDKFTLLYLKYNLKGERDKIILQILRELYKLVDEFEKQLIKMKFKESSHLNIDELYYSKKMIIIILRLLVQHTQIYLKLEWERIKNESVYDGSVKHRREKIKRKMEQDRLEFYKEQLNFDEDIKSRYDLLIGPTYNRFKKQLVRRWIE